MKDLGEFVSVFKRALRDQFRYEVIRLGKILVITDLEGTGLSDYRNTVVRFLEPVVKSPVEWRFVGRNDWKGWPDMKAILDNERPDLVVTYRLLNVAFPGLLTSLGVYVDSMTQVTDYPVLLMPNPHLTDSESAPEMLGNVVVATEHMYVDHSLVNYGIAFTPEDKELILCHIEDEDAFEYYMKAIEKIPELDNEIARVKINEQLREMPHYFAESVKEALADSGKKMLMRSHIDKGHIITKYRELIAENPVSLLVFTTKDDTQLAMHSLGYSLAVEFRNLPILLI